MIEHIIKTIEENRGVIRSAPWAFAVSVFAASALVGFIIHLYDIGLIDELREQNQGHRETVNSYRIHTREVSPSAATTLTEKTNRQLKRQAENLVKQIRFIQDLHVRNLEAISEQLKSGKVPKEKYWEMATRETKRAANQFNPIRTDCIVTVDELRERMAPAVKEKVIGANPGFRSADFPDAVINFAKISAGQDWFMLESNLGFLLRELEELGRLLPDTLDFRHPDKN